MSDKLLKQPMAHTLDDCQNWSCPAYSKEAKTCIAGTNPLTCMRYLMDQTRQAYFDEKKAYRTETELNATKLVGLLDIPSNGDQCGSCRFRLSMYVEPHGCILFNKTPEMMKFAILRDGNTVQNRCSECKELGDIQQR